MIGGAAAGPTGAAIGNNIGYAVGALATAWGVKKHREATRAHNGNGTTATPGNPPTAIRRH